jgi:hypothetical protein
MTAQQQVASDRLQQLRSYINQHPAATPQALRWDPIAFNTAASALQIMYHTTDRDDEQWFECVEAMIVATAQTTPQRPARQNGKEQLFKTYNPDLYISTDLIAPSMVEVRFDKKRAAPIPASFVHTPTIDEMLQQAQHAVGQALSCQTSRVQSLQTDGSPHNNTTAKIKVVMKWITPKETWGHTTTLYAYRIK